MRTIVTENYETAVKVICIKDYLDVYERMGLNGPIRNETRYIKGEIYLANYSPPIGNKRNNSVEFDLYVFVEDSNHSWTPFNEEHFQLLDKYVQDKIKDVLS